MGAPIGCLWPYTGPTSSGPPGRCKPKLSSQKLAIHSLLPKSGPQGRKLVFAARVPLGLDRLKAHTLGQTTTNIQVVFNRIVRCVIVGSVVPTAFGRVADTAV